MNRVMIYGVLVLGVVAVCELVADRAATRVPPPAPFVPRSRTSPHAPRHLPCDSWPRPKDPPPRCRCEQPCIPEDCNGLCCFPSSCGIPK